MGEGDHDRVDVQFAENLSSYTLGSNIEDGTVVGTDNFTLFGNAAANILRGNSATNGLLGGDGNDNLSGLGGNDFLTGGKGADRLDGGTETDTANYSESAARVSINLLAGTASGGDAKGDTLISIEDLVGSNHDDKLTGNAASNDISGEAGDDTIEGGANGDLLHGGDGINTVSYAGSSAAVFINFVTAFAGGGDAAGDWLEDFANIIGSTFDDLLTGDSQTNVIHGGGGNDLVEGEAGADQLFGGAGEEFIARRKRQRSTDRRLRPGYHEGQQRRRHVPLQCHRRHGQDAQ